MIENRLEEAGHVLLLVFEIEDHVAIASGTIDDRSVELFVIGIKLEQKLEDFLIHFLGLGVFAVDLIDHDYDLESVGESFAKHETGLGLRTVVGIDDEKHAIDHAERTFDFTAKVGVTWGVENVDDLLVPVNRGVLGLDRDAFFLLKIHGIHGAIFDGLILPINATFLE